MCNALRFYLKILLSYRLQIQENHNCCSGINVSELQKGAEFTVKKSVLSLYNSAMQVSGRVYLLEAYLASNHRLQ